MINPPPKHRTFDSSSPSNPRVSQSSTALAKVIASHNASEQIFAILKETLSLVEAHRPFVDDFTWNLRKIVSPAEPSLGARERLHQGTITDEIKLHVTAEFVASTNYLAFAMGHVPSLQMLKGRLKKQM